MKEDILEQLVDDYLKSQGYFTTHNIKFKPDPRHKDYVSKQDSVPSDIDLLAVHPNKRGADKVVAVTCKSWQTGINPSALINAIETDAKLGGRIAWKSFRELKEPKWSAAYCQKIEEMTGSKKFTYWTAVTKVIGDPLVWENHKALFCQNDAGRDSKQHSAIEACFEWRHAKLHDHVISGHSAARLAHALP